MSKELENYADSIKLLVPINELPANVQSELCQKGEFISVKKGKFLFKQGDTDNFSFYLLEGDLELIANDQLQSTVQGGSDRARYALAQLQPRQMSARAKTLIKVLRIERDLLDKFMIANSGNANDDIDLNSGVEMEVSDIDDDEDVDWMTRMLQSELFLNMPTANMHQLFACLETLEYEVGDDVIKQGDAGDHYYIIQEGRCEVLRKASDAAKEIKLAELKAGDSFGEEALLMDTTRNATIRMLSAGLVARLSKDDFIELIKKPTLSMVPLTRARELIDAGAKWLDVRYKNEFTEGSIEGAINIPLNMLRMQADKLDQDAQYIVYCDTGGRSSAASFLLTERGLKSCYLNGGLITNSELVNTASSPAATEKSESQTAETPPAEPKKETASQSDSKAEQAPEKNTEKQVDKKPETDNVVPAAEKKEVSPEVREAAIDVELEKTNMKLQEAEKLRAEVDAVQKKQQQEIQKKLEDERQKLQQAKKAAEDEIKQLREAEQKKIEQMKAETEKRLMEEKKKLEEIYSKNTEEMEAIQKEKEAAAAEANARQAQIKKDAELAQQKLEEAKRLAEEQAKQKDAQTEEARKMLEEAKRLKAEEQQRRNEEAENAREMLEQAKRLKEEAEASRLAMEKEVEDKAKAHDELQKKLQSEARARIEAEKRKLADQLAKNNEQLEQAQKERELADAARKAAHEEAQKIIEEYKKEQEAISQQKEEQMREEKAKLEQEAGRIQATMQQIQQEKETAEKEKMDAQKQVAMLKIRQQQKTSEADKQDLQDQIQFIQEKVSDADKHLEEVMSAEKETEAAKILNEEGMTKHTEELNRLRDEVQQDLQNFIQEHEELENASPKFETDPEYMKRLQEKAEEARRQEAEATDNLFADISSQLSEPTSSV